MSLKGNLQSVDLANVLQMLSINQKEGTLVLFDGDTRKSIYFSRDGVSMLSRGRRGQDSLGRILLRYGRITREQLEQALVKQKAEGRRLGEILGEMGAATSEDVENAVRTQIEEEIYNLFIWKEASFEFVEGPPSAAQNVPAQVTFNVNSLIMEAQRRADEWNYIRGLVPTMDEIYKPTGTMDQAEVSDEVFHLPFAPRVLEVLHQGRLSVAEIIQESCAAKFEACKMLALLLEQGAIEPVSIADLQVLAQEATSKNDHPQAAKFLSRIVELGGATPPVNMQLGYALEALDEPERASLFLKAAADSYVEAVEPAHAFEAYHRVVQSLPTDLQAVTQMVEIACGNPEILASKRHDVIEAGRTLARCQKEMGRLPAALHILHRLALATPQDLPLRNMLVQAYQESGMNNEAMTELEAMAEVCTRQANYDEAIRCLRRVTVLDRNRVGIVKKIENLGRLRDRGKRLVLRIVAAAAVLLSIGAAAWGFLWFQGVRERHRIEVEKLISDRLDPLKADFEKSQKEFNDASSNLQGFATLKAEGVARDVKTLRESLAAMEAARAEVERRARGILSEHDDGCEPTENLVEKRTATMKRVLLDSARQRDSDLQRVVDGAQDTFRTARGEAEHHPIRSIEAMTRAVALLAAAGRPEDMMIPVAGVIEDAAATLRQLEKYAGEVEAVQVQANALWDQGKGEQARDLLVAFLARFPTVTQFVEILEFRLTVRTVPAKATVRILGRAAEASGVVSPRVIPCAPGSGLSIEVSKEGFETREFTLPPVKAGLGERELKEQLPHEVVVVLSKVPQWTLELGTGSLDAAPAASPDGAAVVLADRAGWLHLVSVADGKEIARHDAGTLSGFAASPVVTADSVYVASLDGAVLGFDLLGLRPRWSVTGEEGPGPVAGRPVLAGDLLIVAGTGGRVVALRARDGTRAWDLRLPSGTRRDLALVGGRVVVLCDDGKGRVIPTDGREVLTFLPGAGTSVAYPAPAVGPVPAGGKVLLGLDAPDREIALVDPPLPGSTGESTGYRWGVGMPGTEPAGAVVLGEDVLLLYRNGTARLATIAKGEKPGRLPFRILPEKEKPLGSPAPAGGTLFQAAERSLTAFRLTDGGVEQVWRWTAAEGTFLSTPACVAGRFVVIGTPTGRVHGLLQD